MNDKRDRAYAYILRIAAILELNEGSQGVVNLSRALRDLDSNWSEQAIMAAVAHVRQAAAHAPWPAREVLY